MRTRLTALAVAVLGTAAAVAGSVTAASAPALADGFGMKPRPTGSAVPFTFDQTAAHVSVVADGGAPNGADPNARRSQ